jgi:hypothetical protein
MAGEGIEYAWGVSKSIYRLSGFHNLVKNQCRSRHAIPTESVRRVSHRARSTNTLSMKPPMPMESKVEIGNVGQMKPPCLL